MSKQHRANASVLKPGNRVTFVIYFLQKKHFLLYRILNNNSYTFFLDERFCAAAVLQPYYVPACNRAGIALK
jgi:hypothetical protein